MGYSFSKAAGDLLENNFKPSGNISNVWMWNGREFMYEIETKQENEAGDIMGTVFVYVGDNRVQEVGKFCIAGDGMHVTAPAPFCMFFWNVLGVDLVTPTNNFQFPEREQ